MVAISVKEDEASINPDNVTDSETINPGETVEITVSARQLTETVDVYLGGTAVEASDDLNERVGGNEIKLGTADPNGPPFQVFHYTPEQPGTLNAYTSNTWGSAVNAHVEAGDGSGGIQNDTAYAPDEEVEELLGEEIDPANYAGIVNADNQSGIAFAPNDPRTADPSGTEVVLSDGKRVTVYPPGPDENRPGRSTQPTGGDGGSFPALGLLVLGGLSAAAAYVWGGR